MLQCSNIFIPSLPGAPFQISFDSVSAYSEYLTHAVTCLLTPPPPLPAPSSQQADQKARPACGVRCLKCPQPGLVARNTHRRGYAVTDQSFLPRGASGFWARYLRSEAPSWSEQACRPLGPSPELWLSDAGEPCSLHFQTCSHGLPDSHRSSVPVHLAPVTGHHVGSPRLSAFLP